MTLAQLLAERDGGSVSVPVELPDSDGLAVGVIDVIDGMNEDTTPDPVAPPVRA